MLYAKTQHGVTIQTLKDLIRLEPDTVELWDDVKWNKVVSWIGNYEPKDMIDITLRNGEIISCTGDHRIPINDQNVPIPASRLKVGDILMYSILPDERWKANHLKTLC